MKCRDQDYRGIDTKSLPSRERGLKLELHHLIFLLILVAPLTGAWIEIRIKTRTARNIKRSLPSRERGLKSEEYAKLSENRVSLPSRERGLKFVPKPLIPDQVIVAPLTGAWIEIDPTLPADPKGHSRSPHGSVD